MMQRALVLMLTVFVAACSEESGRVAQLGARDLGSGADLTDLSSLETGTIPQDMGKMSPDLGELPQDLGKSPRDLVKSPQDLVKPTHDIAKLFPDLAKPPDSGKVDSAAPTGTVIPKAYVTGYSWFDNTPPGSAAISHPQIHQTAGGTGTWNDPITLAVGHDLSSGKDVLDYPAGSRFYIPDFKRYFIVEDTCGDGPTPQNGPCHLPPSGATTWLDVWIGGASGTNASTDACMNKLTGIHQVVLNPDPNRPVDPGELFSGGSCQL